MSRDVCYICGNKNRDVLEEHHIAPRRFGGSDSDENLVQLCSNCHTSLERLYDNRFYDELGVSAPAKGEKVVCESDKCTSENTKRVTGDGAEAWLCPRHRMCAIDDRNVADRLTRHAGGGCDLLCSNHNCEERGCWNTEDLVLIGDQSEIYNVLCETHAQERGFLE